MAYHRSIRPLSMLLIGSQYLFTNILGKQVWDVVQFQILLKQRMLLKRGTGNGERGTGNGERGTGNGSLGTSSQR